MSEQLDWLARNVHVWPLQRGTALFIGRGHHGEGFNAKGRFEGFYPGSTAKVTRQQWLDRRAELQNKPSWKDAPEWAEWLCQRDDGAWFWLSYEPTVDRDEWGGKGRSESCFPAGDLGPQNILGDWRDTLEQRPSEQATNNASEPEADHRYAMIMGGEAEFEPFTSLEDAQPMGEDKHATLHTIHHAAFLHRGCQLLLSEPELAVFRTADGELIHCKPKECLIDPDVYGLAARLLADMSGYQVAPEHMRELVEQMGWRV